MTLRVNGQAIPEAAIQYELTRLVKFYATHMSEEQVRRQMPILKEKARQQAIGAKLLIEQAARLDIRVPEKDIRERFDAMIAEAGGAEKFERMLAAQRIDKEALRESIIRGRRVDLLVEKVAADAPEPTEEELRAHFEAHADEYARPDQVQAQHILLSATMGDKQARDEARGRLGEIRDRIMQGADFAHEAAAHSDCPSGARSGGSLGWISRGAMVPEFDQAVFSMEVGALSELVETELGVHLIRKTAEEQGGPASFEDVRDKVRSFLRHARRGEALSAYVEDLKTKATIEDT